MGDFMETRLERIEGAARFLRQGQSLFLPRPWMNVSDAQVLHRQPIHLGGRQSHVCERLYRQVTRNGSVFVRGAVWQPDHTIIYLPYWHQVVMNTETQSRVMAEVAVVN